MEVLVGDNLAGELGATMSRVVAVLPEAFVLGHEVGGSAGGWGGGRECGGIYGRRKRGTWGLSGSTCRVDVDWYRSQSFLLGTGPSSVEASSFSFEKRLRSKNLYRALPILPGLSGCRSFLGTSC